MGFFNRSKGVSYEDIDLETLLQDSKWSNAIRQAGIDVNNCEVVIRLASPTVVTGRVPEFAEPAILFGYGSKLAMAFHTKGQIKVETRETSRAEIQTIDSGMFQILFGPLENHNGFLFYGTKDNLILGTPEGEKFGEIMLAFLRSQLKPGQIFGTPQSLVSTNVSLKQQAPVAQSGGPVFEDPWDDLRWKMVLTVRSSVVEILDKHNQCLEAVDNVQRAYAMANSEFVEGVRQHEISRNHFRELGRNLERELEGLLIDLHNTLADGKDQWSKLLSILPEAENDIMKLVKWCSLYGIDSDLRNTVIVNAFMFYGDWGTTIDSFLTEEKRICEILKRQTESGH